MKKTLLLTLSLLTLVACRHQTQDTSVTNPIMPIHYVEGTTMHVFLTDYLPQLTFEEQLTIETEDNYRVENYTTGELDLTGDNTLGNLRVIVDSTIAYDICILPSLPYKACLRTVSCSDTEIAFGTWDTDHWTTEPIRVAVYVNDELIDCQWCERQATDTLIRFGYTIAKPQQRDFIRVFACTANARYNDLLIPLQDGKPILSAEQLTRQDDQAQILYSLMVDRFADGNTANNWKMNSPEVLDIVDYQGGDFAGITRKIQEGYFDSLQVTTLWISPITQNPWDAWGKYTFKNGNKYDPEKTYTRFSGYHGYWPIFATCLEKRFGTPAELNALLKTAHEHHINVILDYVANHMHIASPTLQEHPDWHTDSILPDGRRNFELWDDARLTTWFDTHIPTLDLERPEVCEPMTDSALYWMTTYPFDGFRHDACKHIPEDYWRLLTHKMRTRFPNRHFWMIGETYGSPELIGSYVKSGMLNAQFDFNIYFTATHALAGDGSMSSINDAILTSLATYGAHHTMGNISGNHDQVRYASLADGAVSFSEDPKEAGWTRNVRPASELAYIRAMQLEVLNMTIPGVPCIYQGDEFAEVGANDPDNRHMMRFDALSDAEQTFLGKVKRMTDLRRHSMALMYGEYIPIVANQDTLEFERVYMNERVRVRIVRDQVSEITIENL
ncbi:MAG: hypothetical protein IJP52_00960 [Paludibacteraceae bacterium]|nr:hypothetical protein [Paludibacteraceae bacterium]